MQNGPPRKRRNCRGRLWRSYCKCGQPTMSAHCAPLQICFFSHYSRTTNSRPYRITSHPLARNSMFLWNAEGGVPYKVFPYIIKAKPTMGAHCAPLQICSFSHYSRTANGRPYRITSHPLARNSMFLWNAEGGVPYKASRRAT